jgi:tellurite resistance protein
MNHNESKIFTEIESEVPEPIEHRNDLTNSCKALLIVAGADGEVSDEEWNVIFEFIDSVGGSLELADTLQAFDYSNGQLDQLVKNIKPNLHRHLLFNALRVARADGLSDEERKKAKKLAELTKIDISIASTMEHLLNLEDELRNLKFNLLTGSK